MIYQDQLQDLFYVYIIECNDNSFYTGLTNDLVRRFDEHLKGEYPQSYTFKRRPLKLVYYETTPFLTDAVEREKQIKDWSRNKKKMLIRQDYHMLQLLSQCNNLSHHKYKDLK